MMNIYDGAFSENSNQLKTVQELVKNPSHVFDRVLNMPLQLQPCTKNEVFH